MIVCFDFFCFCSSRWLGESRAHLVLYFALLTRFYFQNFSKHTETYVSAPMASFKPRAHFDNVLISRGRPDRKVVPQPLKARGLLHSGMSVLSLRTNVFAARQPLTSLGTEPPRPPPGLPPSSALNAQGTLSEAPPPLDAKTETTNPSLARKDTSMIYHL